MNKHLLSVILAGLWITASEFIRNELIFKSHWVSHFSGLGLHFETLPLNGALWTLWSLGLAALIAGLRPKFTFAATVGYAWLAAFPLMWICLFNLQVLPLGLLVFAIPLSLLEVAVATLITSRILGAGK